MPFKKRQSFFQDISKCVDFTEHLLEVPATDWAYDAELVLGK